MRHLQAALLLAGGIAAFACESPTKDTTGYTKIDDMESDLEQVVWPPTPGALPGRWVVSIDCTEAERVAPPPYYVNPDVSPYADLPAANETLPGITSRRAMHFRTTTPIASVWGANENLFFGVASVSAPADAGVPAGQPCRQGTTRDFPVPSVDLTGYTGITVWAKAEAGGAMNLKVKMNDRDTDPRGGVCNAAHPDDDTDCYNGFATSVTLTDVFARYTIDFSTLAQDPTWGFRPDPSVLDLSHVYGLIFEFDTATCSASATSMCAGGVAPPLSFDFWLDDLYFVNAQP